jgi:hypothetical protein
MSANTIVVLGDSTSMTVGAEQAMYPFRLATQPVWAPNSKIVNCSIPGFTSTDACAFFFRNLKTFDKLAGVIIYLGNCDTLANELKKGRYSRWQDRIARAVRMGKAPQRQHLKNRLLHYEWNSAFDQYIEAPVAPSDFEHNISKIAAYCESRDVPVVLVRPEAHVFFPAGAGKGNFAFYHYLDLDDRADRRIVIPDARFAASMKLYENEEYAAAAAAYNEVLLESGPLSANLEFKALAAHNFAICQAKLGEFTEAKLLLELIAKERAARKEIVLYNLAMLARQMGDEALFRERLDEAYEGDESMYRIRAPYKQAVDRIAERFKRVHVITLADFIADSDFVDHCHPLPQAQRRLSDQIISSGAFASLANGNHPLEIENHLFNPEYAEGNETEFHVYFRSFSALSREEIERNVERLQTSAKTDGWEKAFAETPEDIRNALDYALSHPAFSNYRHVLRLGPAYPSDVGRFPEFFVIRALLPFLKDAQAMPDLQDVLGTDGFPLRQSNDLIGILPEGARDWVAQEVQRLDDDEMTDWCDSILARVAQDLQSHLAKGNQVHHRIKSTIFWYFREVLRFGAHSRVSMRYERVLLEAMAEALAVAAYFDAKTDKKRRADIESLISALAKVVGIHEKYCVAFAPDQNAISLLADYDGELKSALLRLGAVP